MAAAKGVILCANVSSVAASTPVFWPGGFAALIIIAGTFPTVCFLQTLAADAATWVNLAPATQTSTPTTIGANSGFAYNLPAGMYRINMSGGSVAGLYANLVSVAFD